MAYKLGDAVRLRQGSKLSELLDPWDEATGRVVAVFDEMDQPRANVLYGPEGPLASTVLASEFETDPVGFDGPF